VFVEASVLVTDSITGTSLLRTLPIFRTLRVCNVVWYNLRHFSGFFKTIFVDVISKNFMELCFFAICHSDESRGAKVWFR
jgi:hypothetical protein